MVFITLKKCIPIRAIIATMLFTCTFILYVLRTNLSIIILAMVEPSKNTDSTIFIPECAKSQSSFADVKNQTNSVVPDYGERYDWDLKLQGIILGAYFWGFTISGIPGGALAERYGPSRCVTIAFIISAALTLVAPWAASLHPLVLAFSRFVIGGVSGVLYPSMHCLIASWAPPDEKGKFVGSLMGASLGTVISWPALGAVIEVFGWKVALISCGVLSLLWTVLWWYCVTDSPEKHPWITENERKYIKDKIGPKLENNKKKLPPYKSMALSLPFWALLVLHFGNLWGLFFLMTAGPNFMSSVLAFDIGHTGFLAALPYLARLIFGFLFGQLGDLIIKKQWMRNTTIRKSFVLFSHILPGILLLVQTFIGCDATWAIILITMSLGFNGASTLTNLQNPHDLAPNFAGAIYGIINSVGSTSGFISPLIVGYLTAKHNGLHEWHIIFYIGATVYIACGVVFYIFGDGNLQPWNNVEVDSNNKEDEGHDNLAFNDVEITKYTETAENK